MNLTLHDDALRWVSESGSGTLGQFRDVWDWLNDFYDVRSVSEPDKAWVELSRLSALGHVEVRWQTKHDEETIWAATPPILTMLANSGGRALLVGARKHSLIDVFALEREEREGLLAETCDRLGIDAYIEPLIAQPSLKGPRAIVIAADDPAEVERLAKACGIGYSYSISHALAALLPPLRNYERLWERRSFPQGHPIELFDPTDLSWQEVGERELYEPGLYRVRMYYRNIHLLVVASPSHEGFSTLKEIAIYERLRWDQISVLEYSRRLRQLWLPIEAPLPPLHARAATLATGLLPMVRRRGGYLGHLYLNIEPFVADKIASSLSQELIEID